MNNDQNKELRNFKRIVIGKKDMNNDQNKEQNFGISNESLSVKRI